MARLAVFAAALLTSGLGGQTAHAQWGWGMGWGWGGGGNIGNMAIMNNINDRSASAANHAYAIRQSLPGSGNVYRGNPNSYINNVRDTSFFQRYDVASRRTMESEASRRRQPGLTLASVPSTSNAGSAPTGRQVLPLAGFFTGAGVLVWPGESPTTGELGMKKAAADTLAHSVFEEVKSQGHAPVALVSDTRTRLIEYGRPALTYMREHTTPAVVEAFHQFLLGIYDAIGAAALPAPKR